jgi:hypothetical protein
MAIGEFKAGRAGEEMGQQPVQHGKGDRLAKLDHLVGAQRVKRSMAGELKAFGQNQQGRDIAGDGSVGAHIHESGAVGNLSANLNHGAGRAAESRRWKHPGQRAANAMGAAGKIVSELMRKQDAHQGR